MLKIVVFDGGWGGELVADYLAEELQTIEIERVIDWKHAPYDNKTISEIESLSEDCLRPYVGKVDLIVLGGYATSLALEFLEQCRSLLVWGLIIIASSSRVITLAK